MSKPKFRSRRVWFFKLTLVVLAPLVFFVGLELSLRLFGFGRDTRFFVPDEELGGSIYRTNPRYTELFFPASFGLKPFNFRIDRKKSAGVKRVFLVGESAAMGVPEPGFGMAPQLEAILRNAYPDKAVEVYNLGITAINSHAILPIVEQAAGFDPDLFVFYIGNNEVVGPFGPGSAITEESPPLAFMRASLWLKGTRTGQLIERLIRVVASRSEANRDWGGMEMFTEETVPSEDPRLDRVYQDFAANLRDMLEVADVAGIPSVVSTVAVNHLDCAPFASVGEVDADAHFQRGRSLWQAGEWEAAEKALRNALEFDALRFRADAEINDIVRRATNDFESATLVDAAESLFPGGRELFFEHVHLTFEGNYAIARELAVSAGPVLYPGSAAGPFLASEEVADKIGFTEVGRLAQWQAMNALVNRPPFTGQSTYTEDRAFALKKIQALSAGISPTALAEVSAIVSAGRDLNPKSAFLAFHEAKIAMQLSDYEKAQELVSEYERLAPRVAEVRVFQAYLYAQTNQPNKAEEVLVSTVESEPFYSQSYQVLASLWIALGRLEKAQSMFSNWVAQMPDNRNVRLPYAQVLLASENELGAAAQWEAVLEIAPDDERALLPLLEHLFRGNRFEEALDRMLAAHSYNPMNFSNNDRLVQVYQQRGDVETTLKFMRDLLASGPVSAELRREYEELVDQQARAAK
ncbi:tetratricopeptide repeat protein [Pelagicoccus sp. SDUM812002]|uniref:tetratricopeptide repeat protein n=1 Tax=Pelagicoccus sp. SDUM812002 TaxID=3041266 RepID=UPI00280FF8B0|nr:tetratricopeptide repeat protein [Pelagicoccus sp. SDUM812002]MDQ8185788.1 hypothetical protein [Pelagicoccus sp. SDUM812002]